ncbi:hypothetical protein K2173_012165 [Erythroxylum novogranatense]|uniref:Uncharacterized protein n=1 Tax=Erythroxylum novogranatense TaxID=1862640 RepID=A0AAV8SR88_9ROSI|nr:hypothetical protein K2173_012165 [Erythroxylum novogranatense]
MGKRGGASTPVPTCKLMGSVRTPSLVLGSMSCSKMKGEVMRGLNKWRLRREARGTERARSENSGCLPPHLSDSSHSPVSEIETRSRSQTPSGSGPGVKTHLKDNEAILEDREVEDGLKCEEDLAEVDVHSIDFNMDNNGKCYKWIYPLALLVIQ